VIPRLKPFLGIEELAAPFLRIPDAVSQFETEFASIFESKYAISFPYGRSALWAFFMAMDIHNAEIILPAYTCSVVAHAIVLSNNIPRFVDIRLDDYNMDLEQVKEVITPRTRAIIATHLFGYALNVEQLKDIVQEAELIHGHKIWIIQDCAHSFGAAFNGQLVTSQPDAALFGLNISKQFTSIFGGMLTTNNAELARTVNDWKEKHFRHAGMFKSFRRWLYLLAVYPAFFEPLYGLVFFLQYRTPLLNHLTRAYHLDEKIHFPPGFDEYLLPIEAKVGLVQLRKYSNIIKSRRETAAYYHEHLRSHAGWEMPPLVDGATYSHYVIRVPDRERVINAAAQQGLQLGELIEYSIPESDQYKEYVGDQTFPNSSLCSRSMINLPVYSSLSEMNKDRIVKIINSIQ
jgi:dTDP-4-amino-4,6-dideoxygalactose transaminase